MIRFENVTKTFYGAKTVEAVRDVNFEIKQGDIYGIIGLSGAGKSTLVRCINFLERPTSGKVFIEDRDLSQLSEAELRGLRADIGMIFQNFNLLMQKSVLDNIVFPLSIAKVPKKEAVKRALELLEIVGLGDKAKAYPAQLSGGQKQRVAIARALATNPKILLCDEATSALDPQTTKSILELLKKINREFGITIVIITHEMTVVQEICNRVAIVDKGRMVEEGDVEEVFTHPKSAEARKLIIFQKEEPGSVVEEIRTKRCIRIIFKSNSSLEPVIANMILQFKTPVNILRANTRDISGIAHGDMILGLPEEEEISNRMISYLKQRGLEVEEVASHV